MDKENKKKVILVSLIALGTIVAIAIGSLIYLGFFEGYTADNTEVQSTENFIEYDANDPNKKQEFIKKTPARDDLTEEELEKMREESGLGDDFIPPPIDD